MTEKCSSGGGGGSEEEAHANAAAGASRQQQGRELSNLRGAAAVLCACRGGESGSFGFVTYILHHEIEQQSVGLSRKSLGLGYYLE